MTTGSYNRGAYVAVSGGRVGTEDIRSWSGIDEPFTPRIPLRTYETVREVRRKDGTLFFKKFHFRTRDPNDDDLPTRKRSGEHPYTMSSYKMRSVRGYYKSPLTSVAHSQLGVNMTPSSGLTSLVSSNDQIALVGKLREKLHGTDFNASVTLGEGHRTLKMIADSAIRIAKAGYHIRRGDISGAARSLLEGTSRAPLKKRHEWDIRSPERPFYPNLRSDAQNLSSHWLELQYGWKPLLHDVVNAAGQLAHHLEIPMRHTYRVKIHREQLIKFRNNTGLAWGFGYLESSTVKTHDRWLIARVEEKDLPSVSRKLGLLDPELVAWELTPFSFVADWFIPFGQYMEARALSTSLKGTFITSDLITVKCDSGTFNQVPGYRGKLYDFVDPGQYSDRVSFTRAISSTLNVPLPRMQPLNKVASWLHCANAVALVTQIFSGRKVLKTSDVKALAVPNRMPVEYWHL